MEEFESRSVKSQDSNFSRWCTYSTSPVLHCKYLYILVPLVLTQLSSWQEVAVCIVEPQLVKACFLLYAVVMLMVVTSVDPQHFLVCLQYLLTAKLLDFWIWALLSHYLHHLLLH